MSMFLRDRVGLALASVSAAIAAALAAFKLDDLATPDDNTDLNASATRHGLLPKLSNTVTNFLNGQGGWTTPDHGSIGGLTDDDHAQYSLVDGTRAFTGAAKTIAGTAGTPGLRVGDDDTGLYLSNTNQVGVTSGGVPVCHFVNGAILASGGLALGFPSSEFGSFYHAGAYFHTATTADRTTSGAISAAERYSIWNGSNLTATFPSNPTNGTVLAQKNLHATALTIAAGSGDTLFAGDVAAIVSGASCEWKFRSSDRVWYRYG